MIKIITAIGNPILNNELKKYQEFEVVTKDIQYMDGIIEYLEINSNINYLIISEILEGQYNLEEIIELIYNINREIKIIVILENKDKTLEDNLIRKGVSDILYNKTDLLQIINLLKNKNNEYLNGDLREEIEKLKEIIMNKNKIFKNINNRRILYKKEKNNFSKKIPTKLFAVVGSRGIGKSSFLAILAKILKKENKILIIDFDLNKNNIHSILNVKKIQFEILQQSKFNIKNHLLKVEENINLITGLDLLFYYNKLDISDFINELNKIKNNYNYILIDTNIDKLNEDYKKILEFCDYIFFLVGSNNLEIQKSKIILNNLLNKFKINYNKINIILYKYKIIDLLFFNTINLKNIFDGFNVIGKIKDFCFFNTYINNNLKNLYNFKMKKQFYNNFKKIIFK